MRNDSTTSTKRRTSRRRLVAIAVAGALGASLLGAAGPASSAEAMPRQCWYKGWFLEDGVWYYGEFRESC